MSTDPDRFFDETTPGAHEWWYFDAISDDGRDAIVIVWYAALPFDPAYAMAVRRHLARPDRHPSPDPRDHCALGFHWYREGKTVAYALNAYRHDAFAHRAAGPFAVGVAGSRLERDSGEYRLTIDAPSRTGRPIVAALSFRPAPATRPLELDLDPAGAPHRWIAAAVDCRVEGSIRVEGRRGPIEAEFRGRGYHDHNAGADDLGLAVRTWRWGRFHHGPWTWVYYQADPRRGEGSAHLLTFRDGAPVGPGGPATVVADDWRRHPFGVRYARSLQIGHEAARLKLAQSRCVDGGPFYLRWLAEFEATVADGSPIGRGTGFSERLDTTRLHHPLTNWMIPMRLKRPAP